MMLRAAAGALAGAALLASAAPASAERIYTYWRVEPVEPVTAGTVERGKPFLEQRLLPTRLVKLSEPVTLEETTLPPGTLLFQVSNAAGREGFCTLAKTNVLAELFAPAANKRPCLVDEDRDGRFEKRFGAFDLPMGLPTVRGSIDGAKPIGATVRYEDTDPHQYPVDMRMTLRFTGSKNNLKWATVYPEFTGHVSGVWPYVSGKETTEGPVFAVGNVVVLLRSLYNGRATYELKALPGFTVSSDENLRLYWHGRPAAQATGP